MNKCLIVSVLILFAQGSFAQNVETLKLSANIKPIDIKALQSEDIIIPSYASNKSRNSIPANDLEFSKEYVLEQIMTETLQLMKNNGSFIMFPVKTIGDARSNILMQFFKKNYNNPLPNKGAGASIDKFALINAVWALGELGSLASVEVIVKKFPSADQTMRLNMITALGKIKSPQASEALDKIMIAGQDKEIEAMDVGDILFRKGYFGLLNPIIKAQSVGHVGVYVGVENGKHMVIEGWRPIRKISLKKFLNDWPFYGNHTTSPKPSIAQRNEIVEYVFAQLGKPFSALHTNQKGLEKFDCVGLAEAAYEYVGLNPTPDEFESGWGWPLTPTEQYESTFQNFK